MSATLTRTKPTRMIAGLSWIDRENMAKGRNANGMVMTCRTSPGSHRKYSNSNQIEELIRKLREDFSCCGRFLREEKKKPGHYVVRQAKPILNTQTDITSKCLIDRKALELIGVWEDERKHINSAIKVLRSDEMPDRHCFESDHPILGPLLKCHDDANAKARREIHPSG